MENVPLQGKTVMFFHAEGACEHAHVCDGPGGSTCGCSLDKGPQRRPPTYTPPPSAMVAPAHLVNRTLQMLHS